MDLVITVPDFQGKFIICPRSDIFLRILSTKVYEPELVKLSLQFLDGKKDVIDVGANIGFYSVLFAKNLSSNNRVIAIEPTKEGIKRLRYNLLLNEVNQTVEVFEGAASNNNMDALLETIEGKEEYSSLGDIKYPGLENERVIKDKVKCITLDSLVKEKQLSPGFLKIDVEGSEYLVLQGARNTLSTFRPVILSEVCEEYLQKSGTSVKAVIQFIQSCKYDVFDVSSPLSPISRKTAKYPVSTNILCIPKEFKRKSLQ
ncbi:FkbM family methyltransferase [Anaerocolumna cellulosilytica]|nr:FkbM family methyltransferase [Anaerocolumna cellulosilytica]